MDENSKSLSEFNEGQIFKGEKITTLYAAKQEYLIFESDNSGRITVFTKNSELRTLISDINPKISIITEYLTTKQEKKKFVNQIGLAYSEAIVGNIESANKICDKIIERIELYKCNIVRFYYLLSCLITVLLALIISFILKKYNPIPELLPHFYIMTYASIGGFLSIAKNIKKIQIDSSDFGIFQIIYGVSRILISMFSGLIIYLLIKSEMILPFINNVDNISIIYLFAVVAGFSENWIPDLLKKLETEKIKEKKISL